MVVLYRLGWCSRLRALLVDGHDARLSGEVPELDLLRETGVILRLERLQKTLLLLLCNVESEVLEEGFNLKNDVVARVALSGLPALL